MEIIVPQNAAPQPQNVRGDVTSAGMFVVMTINQGAEALDAVRDFCAGLSDRQQVIKFGKPEANFSCVLGIGSNAWDRLFPKAPKPRDLKPLQEVRGKKHTAPSTPGDILLHIRAETLDVCFEFLMGVMEDLSGFVEIEDETHAFHAKDSRNLLGFVDGVANPVTQEDRTLSVCVGDWDEEFKGGSYVVTQKYLHDMDKWRALTEEEQTLVIGRKKLSDVELSDEEKPSNAHNALTVIEVDGVEMDILRDNLSFGNASKNEYGTYFIGYAGQVNVTLKMLENMFIGVPEGNYDRLLDFSTAKTGSLFFCPTVDFLDDIGAPASDDAVSTTDDDKSKNSSDASLGIGSLKK